MYRFLLIGFTTLLILSTEGIGQTGDSSQKVYLPQLSLLIEQALQYNPRIKAAAQQRKAAQERIPQIRSLDDPVLRYTHWFSSVETRVGPMRNGFTLSQQFPFWDKLRFRGDMAKRDVEVAEMGYQTIRRDVIYQIKLAYFDLYWIDQSLAILDEYQQLLQTFRQVALQKYATGAGIQAHVLKAQVEISSIEERRLNFLRLRKSVVARLNTLLGSSEIKLPETVTTIDTVFYPLSESDLLQKAFLSRQELQAATALIHKTELGIRLAKREYWPDFILSATYTTIPSGQRLVSDSGKDPWSIQVSIHLPIRLGKRKAAVEEARANHNVNRMNYENLKNEITSEIRDLYVRLKASEQIVKLYRERLLPDAQRALQSTLSSYQTGMVDFLSLLDSERMLFNFRLMYVRELANYQQVLAGLERAVGGQLP